MVEYGSRLAFMNALQEGFPELLTALNHDVYRPFESHWKHDPPPERGPTIDGTPLRELLIRVHDGRFLRNRFPLYALGFSPSISEISG